MSSSPNEEQRTARPEIGRVRMAGRRGKSARRRDNDTSPPAAGAKGTRE